MKINEIFVSIQGEGPFIGQPAVFVRLSKCNLKCTWCDSKYHTKIDDSISPQSILFILKENPNCKRIVFTGGEPLLQQNAISDFITLNYKIFKDFKIEFETNGTVNFKIHLKDLLKYDLFDMHFNVSPKLASSGNEKIEIFPEQFTRLKFPSSSIFKFVYVPGQVSEILKFIKDNSIPKEKVYIMPEGATKKEQESLMEEVIIFCKQFGFTFSPRLHVLVWDKARGV